MSVVAHRHGRTAEWISIHEAASLVGVSPATLRRWCDAGNVHAYITPGGHRRFSRRAIVRLLPAERAAATDEQLDHLATVLLRKVRLASRQIAAEPPWSAALGDADREDLERLSRQMVADVVHALRVDSSRPRQGLSPDTAVARRCGERLAHQGIELDAMVEAGLLLDALVVHEVADAAGRLALDGSAAARWLELTADCANTYLAEAMRGHAAVRDASASPADRATHP